MSLDEPLLCSQQVEKLLRYPRGRSVKLARAGKIPHVRLPDGEIRFDPDELRQFIEASTVRPGRPGVPNVN